MNQISSKTAKVITIMITDLPVFLSLSTALGVNNDGRK